MNIAPEPKTPKDAQMVRKVCPVVYRSTDGSIEILAFLHPEAGRQFIKGGIQKGELAPEAAVRELQEESGITTTARLYDMGHTDIGKPAAVWHFFAVEISDLPRQWTHQTQDDFGHVFSFFWHPLDLDLDESWHPMFHDALRFIRRSRSL